MIPREPELPACPHCDTTLRPERIGAGRYVCPSCARVFTDPPAIKE